MNGADAVAGKIVAITGASSGIGAATATLLARRGASIVLGSRDAERLRVLEDEIRRAGGTATSVATDVRRLADVERLVATACDRFGRLDVFVGNAGVAPISRLDDLRVDDWNDMIDVNLRGVLHGIAAALPVFRRQRDGHFVHTASTAGLITTPTMAVYSATKVAVRAISEGLRQEAGPDLRVSLVTPGFVRTNLSRSMTDPDIRARIARMSDEMGISPDAVARAIAFAIEQPRDVDVGEIVVRPTTQA